MWLGLGRARITILKVDNFMVELSRTSPLCRYWQRGKPATLSLGPVVISERPFLVKRLLRGSSTDWQHVLQVQLGLGLPERNAVSTRSGLQCVWLRPDEWLVIAAPGSSRTLLEGLALPAGVSAPTCAVIDVSDQFQCVQIRGAGAAELLNFGCSLDFSDHAFPADRCCRTRIEEIPVIITRTEDTRGFDVLPERALADYLWRWLSAAAGNFVHQAIQAVSEHPLEPALEETI
jgi:sarcosine oxidase subunit gamma